MSVCFIYGIHIVAQAAAVEALLHTSNSQDIFKSPTLYEISHTGCLLNVK